MKHLPKLLLTVLVLPIAALAQTSWDMPTPYPEGNFHEQNIATFISAVKDNTNGDLKITLHPNQSLIKHAEIKNSVRDGIVPIGELLVSRVENENPIFGVDSVPFLATSYADARKLYNAQKPYLEKLLDKQGLKLLFSVPWPPQGLYTQDKVSTMADLKGLTFRAYNTSTSELARKAGMVPTQVEASDIPTAFSTGRVEAMMTSPSTGVNSKAWDFLSHYYDMKAWIPRNMVIVSQDAFDRLPKADRQAVLDAAKAAEKRGWKASKKTTGETTKSLKDHGLSVASPSAEIEQGFEKIGAQMTQEWKTSAGEDGAKLLKAYRNQQ